jgi:NAD(P)-dependent dehydrogenase (short-subunit alcohol dehydrogenase family)
MTTDNPIAARIFSCDDQVAFARLSGDSNPMHLDERASRRTMAGAPVVHGVHGALWALEMLCQAGVPLSRLASIKVQFPKFVYLDCEVALRIAKRNDEMLKAELVVDGSTVTILNLKFGPRGAGEPQQVPTLPVDTVSVPRNLTLSEMDALSGFLAATDMDELGHRFPLLCAALGADRTMSLALLSTLVGMICPGLHSIFSGFEVELTGDGATRPGLGWRTERTDERFRSVAMRVWGAGFEGEVQAFARPEPIETPRMADFEVHVAANEFAGRTALVIGGSRGIGAVTAKLLAAGGARVFATYAAGQVEAEALVEDIRAARADASVLPLDITGDLALQLESLPLDITHVYYFATPRIGQQSAKTFSQKRFDALAAFYVDGFARLVGVLAARAKTKPLSILYPSTVFIDERPKGMTEYAMAKAAGEVLARDLASALGIRIATPRIPRVLTDQTVALTPSDMPDPIDVLLPLLRAEPQIVVQAPKFGT